MSNETLNFLSFDLHFQQYNGQLRKTFIFITKIFMKTKYIKNYF